MVEEAVQVAQALGLARVRGVRAHGPGECPRTEGRVRPRPLRGPDGAAHRRGDRPSPVDLRLALHAGRDLSGSARSGQQPANSSSTPWDWHVSWARATGSHYHRLAGVDAPRQRRHGAAAALLEDLAVDDAPPRDDGPASGPPGHGRAGPVPGRSRAGAAAARYVARSGDTATAPDVGLVRARALRSLGRLDDAEAALRSAHEQAASSQPGLGDLARCRPSSRPSLDAQGRGAEAEAARAEALAIVEHLAPTG